MARIMFTSHFSFANNASKLWKMYKRNNLYILLGTVLLFIWNAFSWMALPFHNESLKTIPEPVFQGALMKQQMPESGVYHYPGIPENNTEEALTRITEKLQEGPRITMMVYKNGSTSLFNPMTFLISLFLNLLTVVLFYYTLSKMNPGNKKQVIAYSIGVGLIVIAISDFSLMNWFMFPWKYTLINAMDKIIAFGLLGLLFNYLLFKKQKA